MIETSSQYHQKTSYDRFNMSGHDLDWENQPLVFKKYIGMETISLPKEAAPPDLKLSTLLRRGRGESSGRRPNLHDLSLILRLAYTLTARARYQGGDFYYRSAASAGALYPTEIYVASEGLEGLEDGLYHFAIQRHGLNRLRGGTVPGNMHEIPGTPVSDNYGLAFLFTAIFFRSAWKYRERAYRYHLLDTGHVIENLILALKALHLPSRLSYDFDDRLMNGFLGLDDSKEVCLAVLHVADREKVPGEDGLQVKRLPNEVVEASRVSNREIAYSVIRDFHRAGISIPSRPDQGIEMIPALGIAPERWARLDPPSEWPEKMGYADALFRRRSKRNFVKEPMGKNAMAALLESLCGPDLCEEIRGDFYEQSVCAGFITERAEGLPPGLYLLDRAGRSFGQAASGDFLEPMTRVCLDQAWLSQAAVHFLFMTDLGLVDNSWGPRGYRYAMMTAGRMGERIYVAATAMGLGCCGIGAFYDGEAVRLLGLQGRSRLLYLVGTGAVKGALL